MALMMRTSSFACPVISCWSVQVQLCLFSFLLLLSCPWSWMSCSGAPNIPEHVKIGALVALNSTIGEQARHAIQLAVQDINNAPDVLNGTKVEIEIFDSGCRPVQGAAAVVELVKKGVLAIVGPQSSAVAQFAAHIGRETRVPLISFGATDPSLSEVSHPFFFRVVPSDSMQMRAAAAFIANFGWKEVVVFHMDDDYGTNGASSLSDFLQVRGSKLVDKVALIPWIDKDGIDMQLVRLANRESRVFVLHTYPDVGHLILQEAYFQNMLEAGYVWIVTELMSNSLLGAELDHGTLTYTQGVIGIRQFAPPTSQLDRFLREWYNSSEMQFLDLDVRQINPYLLYAYDAVWTIGRALNTFINEKEAVLFQEPIKLQAQSGGKSELSQLKIFQGGGKLRGLILNTSFQGVSGHIKFDGRGDIAGASFQFFNMVGKSFHSVGYWGTNSAGVSLMPPTNQDVASSHVAYNHEGFISGTPANNLRMPIIWPGKSTDVPRGWVYPQSGNSLKVGVPYKVGYNQIIGVSNDSLKSMNIYGFSVSVFQAALKYLPYAVTYKFVLVGDGRKTPIYDDLVLGLANQDYDALVGDFLILAERLKLVDFTQPYIESGLVLLVPVKDKESSSWAFLRPFTSLLWCTMLFSFLFTGMAIWILEHRVNKQFRGSPKTQFTTVLTFIFSTLFFSQEEDARSSFGRVVLLVWLFVVLIINSSYTASLTSILTTEQLTPSIGGIQSLLHTTLPIGYQTGSFVYNYLRNLNVSSSRLKAYNTQEATLKALANGPSKGGVVAIVDELPYVQLLESGDCKGLAIAGQEFTKTGWGFAFPQGSDITNHMSQAILQMSETGELQRIRNYWFSDIGCDDSSTYAESNQLAVTNVWGLFLVSGIAAIVCVLIHVLFLVRSYLKHQEIDGSALSKSRRLSEHFKQFIEHSDKAQCTERKLGRNRDDFTPAPAERLIALTGRIS